MRKFDVIVVGGSFVGLIVSNILAKSGLKCVLLEKKGAKISSSENKAGRLLALVHNSCLLFKKFSILNDLNTIGQPVNHIRVVEGNSRSCLDFSPQDIGLNQFGYMVDEHMLLDKLKQQSDSLKNLTILNLEETIDIENEKNEVSVVTSRGRRLIAPLVIAADGKNSKIRDLLGIETRQLDYRQHGIVFDVEHEKDHQGVAVENFMPEGPFAILPKKGGRHSSIVWTVASNVKPVIESASDKMLLNLVTERFNSWLGEVRILTPLKFFPLKLIYSTQYYSGRVVFLGDSMHSIHPLAGQGLNLALRDLQVLVNLITYYRGLGLDIGSPIMFNEYKNSREPDNSLMIESMNYLNYVFSNNFLPFKFARRIGLRVVAQLPALKNAFIRYGCGLKYA